MIVRDAQAAFREDTEEAKAHCPVSKGPAGTEIVLEEAYLAEANRA